MVFFYKNAAAIIHPSLSEGFGLPLIEAAYFGLPIIASNIEVFKEILDDNYFAFNPYDITDIKYKISEFFQKKPQFQYKEVFERYSFEKMTKKIVELYKKLLYS